jgi:hypothetical protein
MALVEHGGWSGGGYLLPAGPNCGWSNRLTLQKQQKQQHTEVNGRGKAGGVECMQPAGPICGW